jgi:hypothetical protein
MKKFFEDLHVCAKNVKENGVCESSGVHTLGRNELQPVHSLIMETVVSS